MKIALVHDWLVSTGGAEKVIEAFIEKFPCDIYTLVKDPAFIKESIFELQSIQTSFIQKLPFAKKKYRSYLPLFPLAIEQFDMGDYDVVFSSSHAVAKGVLTHIDQCHICYCHTPMRYAWDFYQQYLRQGDLKKGVKGIFAKAVLHYLRLWDAGAGARVDAYIANSHYVARRIAKTYKREAEVIHPPVDTDAFPLCEKKEEFYLTASRLVPYKRIDLIVEAFTHLPDKKLVVIGDGPEMKTIKSKATKNIEILGFQESEKLLEYMQKAKAFVFAALEDFGIIPIEAQACGTPVIAFGKGGALETVVENKSGIFFPDQTVESLITAIQVFEKQQNLFDPYTVRVCCLKFDKKRFQKEIQVYIDKVYKKFLS